MVYVCIRIHEAGVFSGMQVPEALQDNPDSAVTFAREKISRGLLACVPSLCMVAVRLLDNTSWWRIQGGEGKNGRNLVPISGDTGRRVEAYLYSEEYERTLELDGKRIHTTK